MDLVHVLSFPPLPILYKGKGAKFFYPRSDLLYFKILLKTQKKFISNIYDILDKINVMVY